MDQGEEDLLSMLATDLDYHFSQLVLLYQQRLHSFALRMIDSPQDAEDIVQETFLRAYHALKSYPVLKVRTLRLWNRDTGQVTKHTLHALGAHPQENQTVFAPDGKHLAFVQRIENNTDDWPLEDLLPVITTRFIARFPFKRHLASSLPSHAKNVRVIVFGSAKRTCWPIRGCTTC